MSSYSSKACYFCVQDISQLFGTLRIFGGCEQKKTYKDYKRVFSWCTKGRFDNVTIVRFILGAKQYTLMISNKFFFWIAWWHMCGPWKTLFPSHPKSTNFGPKSSNPKPPNSIVHFKNKHIIYCGKHTYSINIEEDGNPLPCQDHI